MSPFETKRSPERSRGQFEDSAAHIRCDADLLIAPQANLIENNVVEHILRHIDMMHVQ